MADVPQDHIPAASGLANFIFIAAGAIGTSVATTIWEDQATLHHTKRRGSINMGNATTGRILDG